MAGGWENDADKKLTEACELAWDNGDTYVGQCSNKNTPDGHGTIKFANGAGWSSEFENGSAVHTKETSYFGNKLFLIVTNILPQFNACEIRFTVINKTGKDIRKNSIEASVYNSSYNQWYQAKAEFDGIPNGNSMNFTWAFDKFKCVETVTNVSNIEEIGFTNVNLAREDGLKMDNIFILESNFIRGKFLSMKTSGALTKASLNENPKYRAAKAKQANCYTACQNVLEACVLRYKSAANQICGMPNASCFNRCDSIQ